MNQCRTSCPGNGLRASCLLSEPSDSTGGFHQPDGPQARALDLPPRREEERGQCCSAPGSLPPVCWRRGSYLQDQQCLPSTFSSAHRLFESLIWRYAYSKPLRLSVWVICVLLLNCGHYILWKLDPYRLCDLQIPPPVPQRNFLCSQVSFTACKFLILIGSNLSVFPFVAYASSVTAKDRHQIQGHGDLPLCFLVRILQFWLLGFILSFLPNNLT